MKVLIIDGSYLMYKSYFAFKNNHLTVEKENETIITSAIFGFISEIIKIAHSLEYDFIMSVWDIAPYIKRQKISSYKDRPKKDTPHFETEKELIMAILYDLLIPCFGLKGYEGEDIANHIIRKLSNIKTVETVDLYSNDEDCFALLSSKTSMTNGFNKESSAKKLNKFTVKSLYKKYKVTPKEFVEMKAMTGCKSDNIKGIEGIGNVKALWIIERYKTVDDMLRNLRNIKNNNEPIYKCIKKSVINNSLKESIYLTKILDPEYIKHIIPKQNVPYNKILEFIEARTLLTGSNKLMLRHIKKKQKLHYSFIKKILK